MLTMRTQFQLLGPCAYCFCMSSAGIHETVAKTSIFGEKRLRINQKNKTLLQHIDNENQNCYTNVLMFLKFQNMQSIREQSWFRGHVIIAFVCHRLGPTKRLQKQ